MKLLLTGGAGYVGSACLRWLLKNGHDAYAFDSLIEGNSAAVPEGRLFVGDIRDRTKFAEILHAGKFDAVMHFAALASVPDSIADPCGYYDVNVGGTKAVLDAMRDAGVKRFVLSSTAATYSFDAPMPLTEDSAQIPRVPYGRSKLAAEFLVKDYQVAYGIDYVIFRYFNASGADASGNHGESRRKESHLIPLTLLAILGKNANLKVCGTDFPTPDGTCIRDYIHVEDLALAHQLAVESIAPNTGRVYNLGMGKGISVMEVVNSCVEVTQLKVPYELAGRRPGDPAILIASPDRCKTELGWTPRYKEIHEIIESAWRWHHARPDGYPRP